MRSASTKRADASFLADYLASTKSRSTPTLPMRHGAGSFDPASAIFMPVAELDGKVMGYTLSLTHEGTWISGKDFQRDGLIGDQPIAESELRDRQFAQIEVIEPLTMIDLRDDGAIKMGVPTDVAKSSKQSLACKWAVAFHEHRDQVDGIISPSRLNGHKSCAVRSIHRQAEGCRRDDADTSAGSRECAR